MNVVAIIPARYGSSRLPGKPLLDIGGMPMICHVYKRASEISVLDDVVVATDDNRIADSVREIGGNVILTDASHESGTDRIAQAACELSVSEDTVVVNVQGDQPMISSEPVERMIELLRIDSSIQMTTAACPMRAEDVKDPNRVKVVIDTAGRALYFSRSPIPYDRDGSYDVFAFPGYLRHIGIYAYYNSFLQNFVSLPASWLESMEKLEQLRVLENGYRIGVAVVDNAPLDVDTEEDIEHIRRLFKSAD